ncbi:MAG: zinc ribbon domain-containing protein [Clostridia bacterium]|nr:zinc ribbon domain-containing protein [Clostridia bacterium]
MKPLDIYSGTAEFRRLKLLLGLSMTLLTTLLYIVMVGLPALASKVLSYVLLPVWAGLSIFLCCKLYKSVGYRIDAGHISIITGCVTSGYTPNDAVSFSSDMVSLRFRSQKSYFSLKKLISGAVYELNTIFSRASSLVGDVPGMKMMVEIGRMFLRFHLVYMTRCCIAYTFFRSDEGLYLSATEACAIFSINWKQLTKNATDVSIFLTAFIAVLTAALGIGLYKLMGIMGLADYAYFGVILAFMLVLVLKYAYLDSILTIYYIHTFMHAAEYSTPSPTFFLRLEKLSPSFARMANLANGQFPTPKKAHAFAILRRKGTHRAPPARMPDARHTLICPKCRSANLPQAKFCAGCGTQLKRR